MWDATAGTLERKYEGLEKLSSDYAHFDTAKNRFLAAGFHSEILFWNMDSDNVLERFDLGQTIVMAFFIIYLPSLYSPQKFSPQVWS